MQSNIKRGLFALRVVQVRDGKGKSLCFHGVLGANVNYIYSRSISVFGGVT